jgi:hypothetical protein
MEIYILDALLRPIDLVDEYVSFIWTERYAEKGDFQLVTLSTAANRRRFVADTMISIADSKRIMRVQSVEEKDDEDNGVTLTVKGFDLSFMLQQRVSASRAGVAHDGMLLNVTSFDGFAPIELINTMVWRICVPTSGWQLDAGDAIPYLNDFVLTPGSLYPASNIPEPAPGGIVWEQKVASLYSAVTDVCKAYDLGYRLYKDPNAMKLYFEAYNGLDRTSIQTDFPPVIFSSDMTNLQSTTQYQDNIEHYNVVVAIYEYPNPVEGGLPETLTIHEIVSDPQLTFSSGGFDQKTKFISISQLPEGMLLTEVPDYLIQLANEELNRSRPVYVYDGEIDQNSDFVYEQDYFLGDLVEVQGNDGGGAYMRVVEQIIKYDSGGKSSYPSLLTKDSIPVGSWKSWKYNVNWNDMGSGEYWNNQ